LQIINDSSDSYFVSLDGNRNVAALVKASAGTVSASYEYDPFGQTLQATGEYGAQNPVRFSSKYTDPETGLLYYGYRYYNPQTGRWINKDPLLKTQNIGSGPTAQTLELPQVLISFTSALALMASLKYLARIQNVQRANLSQSYRALV
jgi:RHS repeat-associated protein